MQDIINKLVAEIKQRFKGKGGKPKPDAKEIASWGARQLHWGMPFLLSIVLGLLLIGGTAAISSLTGVEAGLVGALAVIAVIAGAFLSPLALILLFVWRSKHNKNAAINACRKLLQRNERFALVEYAKYLKRRIKQAKDQGVPEEQVERLSQAYTQLRELLKQGAGAAMPESPQPKSKRSKQVTIEEEALLAESIAEVYDFAARAGSTERLDQRLSPQVRDRVEELERELAANDFGELRQADELQPEDHVEGRSRELE